MTGTAVQVNRLRSPDNGASLTFGGDSLTINSDGIFALVNSAAATYTFNNVVDNPGGLILNGGAVSSGTQQIATLAGVVTIQSDSLFRPLQSGSTINVSAAMGGVGGFTVRSDVSAGGVLRLNSASNSYQGSVTVESGAVIRQSVAGGLSSAGAGIVTVNGNGNGEGALQLRTGAAASTASTSAAINALAGSGTVVSGNTASTLTIDADSGVNTFSGVVSGANLSLIKKGGSTQVFTGANTYGTSVAGAATTIEDGAIRLSGGGSVSGRILTTGSSSGTLELQNTNAGNAQTLEGRTSTTAHINSIGGNNTVSGALTLQEITGDTTARYNINSSETGAGNSLTVTGTVTGASAANDELVLGGAGNGALSSTVNLAGGGTDAIVKEGAGSWIVSGNTTADALRVEAGTLGLTTNTRTFTTVGVGGGRLDADSALTAGTATVSDGTLDLGAALTTSNAVGVTGGTVTQTGSQIDRTTQAAGFNVTSGAVNLNGAAGSMTALNGAGGSVGSTSAATLTLGNSTPTIGDYAGGLTGALSVVKDGSNTQTLSGVANTTGTIEVQAGGLTMSGAAADTVGGLKVSGGRLDVDGEVSAGTITVSGGTLDIGADLDTTSQVQVTGGTVTQTGSRINSGDQTGGFNVVTNGTVDLNGQNASITALDGDTTGTVDNTALGTATLTLGNTTATSGVFSGTIQDTGALSIVKDGSNTQTLGGPVNIAGNVTVGGAGGGLIMSGVGGTVGAVNVNGARLDVDNTLAAGVVTVSGGTLDLGGVLTTASTVQVTGGAVTQSGSNINRAVQTGGFNLASGSVDLNGAAASMTALDGAGTVTNGSATGAALTLGNSATPTPTAATFSGIIQDGTGGVVSLVKDNSNTQALSGNSTYTGTTTVSAGALKVQSNSALGATGGASGTTATATGRVEFEGAALRLDETFELIGRSGTAVHLDNLASADTIISAQVQLADAVASGAENYSITSGTGKLTLAGGVASALSGDARTLRLGGAGVGTIGQDSPLTGLAMTGTAVNNVTKLGDGNWTINNATIANAGSIVTQSGTLTLAGTTAITDGAIFQIDSGATMNVTGVNVTTGGFVLSADDIMRGNGTVVGNVSTVAGSQINPGSSPGTLKIEGDLAMAGILNIDILSLTSKDLLNVTGALDVAQASLVLNLGSLMANTYYVFATYGSIVPSTGSPVPYGPFASVSNLTGEYEIVYNYNDGTSSNNIALFTKQTQVPVPAPLALIGLGLFGLAVQRRRLRA